MVPEKLNSVLCINDSDITLFILKRTLSKSNFAENIITKKDGLEALNYCKQLINNNQHESDNYPKIIFLDLHMPVVDGWEFLERFSTEIRPYFKDTKIVITSQSIDSKDWIRAKKHPFVIDFLNHFITVEYLTRLRNSLMERPLSGSLKS